MNYYLCELTKQCDFSISHQICPYTVGNKCLFSSVRMIKICLQPAVCYDVFITIVTSKKKSDSNITQLFTGFKTREVSFLQFYSYDTHQVPNDVRLLYLNSYSRLKHTKGNLKR